MDTLAQLEELRLTIGVLALVMLAVIMMATARDATGAPSSPRFGPVSAEFDDADDVYLEDTLPKRSRQSR